MLIWFLNFKKEKNKKQIKKFLPQKFMFRYGIFLPINKFCSLLRNLCMAMYYCFSFCWLGTFIFVGYFTFSWLVVHYKGNNYVVKSQKSKTGKKPFFQMCLCFHQKLALFEKIFWSDDYILMKSNIRKIIPKTHFWTF